MSTRYKGWIVELNEEYPGLNWVNILDPVTFMIKGQCNHMDYRDLIDSWEDKKDDKRND